MQKSNVDIVNGTSDATLSAHSGDVPSSGAPSPSDPSHPNDALYYFNQLSDLYDNGILNLIRRQKSQMYVAILQATFDPLDADIPKLEVLDSFAKQLLLLADTGEFTHMTKYFKPPKNVEEANNLAHKLYNDLSNRTLRTDVNVYRFLEDRKNPRTGEWVSNLSRDAIRAISALEQMSKEQSGLTGIKTNLILDMILKARMSINPNVDARISELERQIAELAKELDEIKRTGEVRLSTPDAVYDQLQLIDDLIADSPAQLMLLTRTLRELSSEFQTKMLDQSISADTALNEHQEKFNVCFVESSEGRRFDDVHRALYERVANKDMQDAFKDFKESELVAQSGFDVDALTQSFFSLYERSRSVQEQRLRTEKEIDSEICRAADMTYTTLREKLRAAYLRTSVLAKRNAKVDFMWADTREQTKRSIDFVRAIPPKKNSAPPVKFESMIPFSAPTIEEVARRAGPRAITIFRKILEAYYEKVGASGENAELADHAKTTESIESAKPPINIAQYFNELPDKYRRECEVAGILTALPASISKNTSHNSDFFSNENHRNSRVASSDTDTDAIGKFCCIREDGSSRVWKTVNIICSAQDLEQVVSEHK